MRLKRQFESARNSVTRQKSFEHWRLLGRARVGIHTLVNATRLMLLTRAWDDWKVYRDNAARLHRIHDEISERHVVAIKRGALLQWMHLFAEVSSDRVLQQQAKAMSDSFSLRALVRRWRERTQQQVRERALCEAMELKRVVSLHALSFKLWRLLYQAHRRHRHHALQQSMAGLKQLMLEVRGIQFYRTKLKDARAKSYLSQWLHTARWQRSLFARHQQVQTQVHFRLARRHFARWRNALTELRRERVLEVQALRFRSIRLQLKSFCTLSFRFLCFLCSDSHFCVRDFVVTLGQYGCVVYMHRVSQWSEFAAFKPTRFMRPICFVAHGWVFFKRCESAGSRFDWLPAIYLFS
jgi:hypothetical protein